MAVVISQVNDNEGFFNSGMKALVAQLQECYWCSTIKVEIIAQLATEEIGNKTLEHFLKAIVFGASQIKRNTKHFIPHPRLHFKSIPTTTSSGSYKHSTRYEFYHLFRSFNVLMSF